MFKSILSVFLLCFVLLADRADAVISLAIEGDTEIDSLQVCTGLGEKLRLSRIDIRVISNYVDRTKAQCESYMSSTWVRPINWPAPGSGCTEYSLSYAGPCDPILKVECCSADSPDLTVSGAEAISLKRVRVTSVPIGEEKSTAEYVYTNSDLDYPGSPGNGNMIMSDQMGGYQYVVSDGQGENTATVDVVAWKRSGWTNDGSAMPLDELIASGGSGGSSGGNLGWGTGASQNVRESVRDGVKDAFSGWSSMSGDPLPEGHGNSGRWGSRTAAGVLGAFQSSVGSTALMQSFSQVTNGMPTSGGESSSTLSMGSYGNVSIDFSTWGGFLDKLKVAFLLSTSFLCLRVIFLKH